jgi:hypothetical protein
LGPKVTAYFLVNWNYGLVRILFENFQFYFSEDKKPFCIHGNENELLNHGRVLENYTILQLLTVGW